MTKEFNKQIERAQNQNAAQLSEQLRRAEAEAARVEAARNSPERRRFEQAYQQKRAAEEARRQELRARDEAEAKEAEQAREKAWEESLKDRRRELKRQWMIQHPSEDPFTFDLKVWPLMKQQLKDTEYSKEAKVARNIEILRNSGMYNF
jgi:hypothetical protein